MKNMTEIPNLFLFHVFNKMAYAHTFDEVATNNATVDSCEQMNFVQSVWWNWD